MRLLDRLRNLVAPPPRQSEKSIAASQPLASEARDYEAKLQQELNSFKDVATIHDLPPIFYYWVRKHLAPIFSDAGMGSIFSGDGPINLDSFFLKYLQHSASATGARPARFASIGAGNCDTEIRLAEALVRSGLTDLRIDCVEVNEAMLTRGQELARQAGVEAHLAFHRQDLNGWDPKDRYCAIIANQSLHHVVELEHLFDVVARALLPGGQFIVSDIIGRNGHQRWPEALQRVHSFWRELPPSYRFNRLLNQHEELYLNWDASTEGFEGVRAQDILPLLVKRFHFRLFIAFGNVIDVFIDRAFGHNFDPAKEWDRDFIDRVHQCDEKGFAERRLTPTHLVAVLQNEPIGEGKPARGLQPEHCIRQAEPSPNPG